MSIKQGIFLEHWKLGPTGSSHQMKPKNSLNFKILQFKKGKKKNILI